MREVQVLVFFNKFPARSLYDFKHEFMVHLKPFVDTDRKLIFFRDFNFELFTVYNDFLNFMKLNLKYEQIVTKETCDSVSQLDLIFTNFPYCETKFIEAYWSDHKIAFCTL